MEKNCRLGSPCPSTHNPADYYIQLLAVIPSQEEECRNKIQSICDSYENSEYAQRLHKELSRQRESKVVCPIYVCSVKYVVYPVHQISDRLYNDINFFT